jgi:hypothetical protein
MVSQGWHGMTQDDTILNFTAKIHYFWHEMTQDDTGHISCSKTFFFALIWHRDGMGWHRMTPGCLPHLKHAFCIEITPKSIRDDKGWHWTMCPAKNMKFRIWFPKDDMGWHRMTLYSILLQKYTIFDRKCPRMTQDDTRHISCCKTSILLLYCTGMTWDDTRLFATP